MPNKQNAILRAVPRATWTPEIGRAFAQVGPHYVICCEPDDEIQSDAVDAAELARRWNAYPHLVEALTRVIQTGNVRRAIDAANEALARINKGAA